MLLRVLRISRVEEEQDSEVAQRLRAEAERREAEARQQEAEAQRQAGLRLEGKAWMSTTGPFRGAVWTRRRSTGRAIGAGSRSPGR